MKKSIITAGMTALILTTGVVADPLKNSLMSAGDKETPMVNIDNLNVAKPKAAVQKSRADDAIVATIQGKDVTKAEADKYLALRSQGHATDFDRLPKEQKTGLVNEMALPLLSAQKAFAELSAEEKNAAMSRMWMQKKVMSTVITDEEAKKAYDMLVKRATEAAKKAKKDAPKIPAFEEAKREVKLQIAQEKVIGTLIKEGDIKLK